MKDSKKIIAWDLGGTKCAAGLIEFDVATHQLHLKKRTVLKLTDVNSLEELINNLETRLDLSMREADAICIGAAGQYDGERLNYAGHYPYPFPFANVARIQEWPCYAIIHDYASILCSTFLIDIEKSNNDIKLLNRAFLNAYGRRVAFGIGTGLGLKDGVLFPNGDFWLGQNEPGHIGIPTPPQLEKHVLDRHQALLSFLQKNQHSLTFEKILSGKGMALLHQFFSHQEEPLTPEEVAKEIAAGRAHEMFSAFAWYLGLFVGTMQLNFMPEGGIWITGGVVLNHLTVFDHPDFIAGIQASPAYLAERERYGLTILCGHEHALMGAGYYAAKRLLLSIQ